MRNLCVWVALAVLAACGPSSGEMKAARTAHYKGDKLELYRTMRTAVEAKYKIEQSDEQSLLLKTEGRWYTPEGLAASERGDMRDVPDRSIQIAYLVKVVADGDLWVVDVKPAMLRYHAGSPKPEPMSENDASIPGWAQGKTDQLVFDIHDALKSWEVKGGGAQMLPPSGPVAPPAGSGSAAASPPPAAPPADPAPAAPPQ